MGCTQSSGGIDAAKEKSPPETPRLNHQSSQLVSQQERNASTQTIRTSYSDHHNIGEQDDENDGGPLHLATSRNRPLGKFRQKYKIGAVLGEGAYSTVRLGLERSTSTKLAIKCINRTKLPIQDEMCLKSEVQILSSLSHPNIVKYIDFIEETKYYFLVLELLPGGELFNRIVHKSFYSEKDAHDVIYNLLLAINYLHEEGIVHRDLKPENLLLKSETDDADIKLADFGFAVRDDGKNQLIDQCGTPGYIAPEILKKEKYGAAADMWSIGVILYILLGGYPPFQDDNERNLFKKIRSGEYEFHTEYWGNVSEEAKDLISRLLLVDPSKRYTAKQCFSHSWLCRDSKELETRCLDKNLEQIRKYVATRKFRAAARAVMAINRFSFQKRSSQSSVSSNESGAATLGVQPSYSETFDDNSVTGTIGSLIDPVVSPNTEGFFSERLSMDTYDSVADNLTRSSTTEKEKEEEEEGLQEEKEQENKRERTNEINNHNVPQIIHESDITVQIDNFNHTQA